MRHRGDIDDFGHDDTGVVDGADRGLTTGARTLDISLHFAEPRIESGLGSVLGSHLGGIRRVLLGTAETALTRRRPGDNLTLGVGEADDHIIEG